MKIYYTTNLGKIKFSFFDKRLFKYFISREFSKSQFDDQMERSKLNVPFLAYKITIRTNL